MHRYRPQLTPSALVSLSLTYAVRVDVSLLQVEFWTARKWGTVEHEFLEVRMYWLARVCGQSTVAAESVSFTFEVG